MTPEAENPEKQHPERRSLSDLKKRQYKILTLIPRTAKENGVYAEILEINNLPASDPRNGLYFVVTPDWQTMETLKRNIGQFDKLLASEKNRSPHMMNCHYCIVPLNGLCDSNIFSRHQQMCKAVQDMAIVVNAFYEYGYPLPEQVHEQTIENFYYFNEKRNDMSLPKRLRDSYDDIMAKSVTDAYQLYSKKEALSLLPVRKKTENRVPADYFIKNHIGTIYESIDSDFLDFILKKMVCHPEFKYYKESAPAIRIKDTSRVPEKFARLFGNPWENRTGIERYNIGFPVSCESLYYGWMAEYNTRGYDKKIPIDELERKTIGLYGMEISQSDMYNFNSLCRANNVEFSVNTGSFRAVTQDNVRNLLILFRSEDLDIVRSILERLGRERRNYMAVNSVMRTKAANNRPQEQSNPYIDDKYVRLRNVSSPGR